MAQMVGETGTSQAHLEPGSNGFNYKSGQDSGSLAGSRVVYPQSVMQVNS